MICPHCGYAMDAFDVECPRCHGKGLEPPASMASPVSDFPRSVPPHPAGTTVLPPSGAPPVGVTTGNRGSSVLDLREPPRRHTVPYVLAALAFCGGCFAPWWQLAALKIVLSTGGEVLAASGAACAVLLMLYDQLQGEREVPGIVQTRTVISVACFAFVAGKLLFALIVSNVVQLSFGLPLMAAAAGLMTYFDFDQLAEEVKKVNLSMAVVALVMVLGWSGNQGYQFRQLTNLFRGFGVASDGSALGNTAVRSPSEVEVILNSTQQPFTFQSSNDFYSAPTPHQGKIFAVCNVTLTFKGGRDSLGIDPSSFRMTASNKHIYTSNVYYQPFTNFNFIDATLLPGGTATGDIVFEIDPGATPEKIEYAR